MTDRLDDKIRAFVLELIDDPPPAPAPATDIETLARQDRAGQPERRDRRGAMRTRRGLAVAMAAAVVILALVGGVALLFGIERSTPPADSPASTTSQPPVTTLAQSTAGLGLTWHTPIEPPSMGTVERLWTDLDGRVFAYGDGQIWMSTDGESWTLAATGPPVDVSGLGSIAAFGDGFAAITDIDRLLVSADGSDWTVAVLPEDLTPAHPNLELHYRVWKVAAGPKGILAAGTAVSRVDPEAVEAAFPDLGRVVDISPSAPCGPDGKPRTCEHAPENTIWVSVEGEAEPQPVSLSALDLNPEDKTRRDGVMWFSEDGITFQTVGLQIPLVEFHHRANSSLVATRDGFAFLDGTMLWTSPDGYDWQQESPSPYDDVTALTVAGTRIIGFTGGDPPRYVRSVAQLVEILPDGSWSLLADAEPSREPVAVGEFGLVAVGYEEMTFPEIAGEEPLNTARVLWFSPDGTRWDHLAVGDLFGRFGALEVAVTDDRVIIVFGANQPEDLERITEPAWRIGIRP